MLKQITFNDYKGFADFRISFGEQAFLVGPNNAGKTTIIAALRLCASLLNHAKRLRPQTPRDDNGRWVHAYNFTGSPLGFVDENVRHEFRDVEPRLELVFKNGARIQAIWPLDDTPFFYLETAPGVYPRRPTEVRETFSTIGVVPILSPIEHDEVALTADHVRESLWAGRAGLSKSSPGRPRSTIGNRRRQIQPAGQQRFKTRWPSSRICEHHLYGTWAAASWGHAVASSSSPGCVAHTAATVQAGTRTLVGPADRL